MSYSVSTTNTVIEQRRAFGGMNYREPFYK